MEFPEINVSNVNWFIQKVVDFITEAIDNLKKFIEGFTSKNAFDATTTEAAATDPTAD